MIAVVSAVLLIAGGALTLLAGIGLLRFGDAISRLHAATKPQILGLLCVLAAIGLQDRRWATVFMLLPIAALQLITTPVAAHMVARAAYRTSNYRADLIDRDDLARAVEAAGDVWLDDETADEV